jgi:hypothetical protein
MLQRAQVHWQVGNGIKINPYGFNLPNSQSTHLTMHVRSFNKLKFIVQDGEPNA